MPSSLSHVARALGGAFAATLVVVGGCFYPSYSFDGEAAGGGGADATTSVTGATTSSSTGSSGGATSGSTTVTTSTGSGGEDCLDGADNDGDSAIDCADTDCQAGYSCVDSIPVGWGLYGYVALAQAIPGNEPSCPTAFPDDAFLLVGGSPIASDATCTPCTCGAPIGQTCALPDQDLQSGGVQAVLVSTQVCGAGLACTGAESVPVGWGGACGGGSVWLGSKMASCTAQPCASSNCNKSVVSGTPAPQGGSCAVGGGDANVPPLTWPVGAKGCGGGQSGGGCGGTATCQANPPAGFEQKLCVAQAGDVPCPESFTVRFLFDDPRQIVDDRGCSACSCSPPTGGTCALDIDVWSDAGCTTKVATLTAPSYCTDLVNNPDVRQISATTVSPPSGSTCAPVAGGGLPTGSVTVGGATTVCCLP